MKTKILMSSIVLVLILMGLFLYFNFFGNPFQRVLFEMPKTDFYVYTDRVCVMGDYMIGIIPDTTSMYPSIRQDSSIVYTEDFSISDIEEYDIVIFYDDMREVDVAHRVVDISEDSQGVYFVTKGDANYRDDLTSFGKIRQEDIIGLVVSIIY